jgi:hypothetical protein
METQTFIRLISSHDLDSIQRFGEESLRNYALSFNGGKLPSALDLPPPSFKCNYIFMAVVYSNMETLSWILTRDYIKPSMISLIIYGILQYDSMDVEKTDAIYRFLEGEKLDIGSNLVSAIEMYENGHYEKAKVIGDKVKPLVGDYLRGIRNSGFVMDFNDAALLRQIDTTRTKLLDKPDLLLEFEDLVKY